MAVLLRKVREPSEILYFIVVWVIAQVEKEGPHTYIYMQVQMPVSVSTWREQTSDAVS